MDRAKYERSAVTLGKAGEHADFNEMVEYVQSVSPPHGYTVNGFPDLAIKLRELGYPAVHLPGRGQKQDIGFQMKLV